MSSLVIQFTFILALSASTWHKELTISVNSPQDFSSADPLKPLILQTKSISPQKQLALPMPGMILQKHLLCKIISASLRSYLNTSPGRRPRIRIKSQKNPAADLLDFIKVKRDYQN